ncbi:MAG: efflux RND transporter permease subunit [Elusimicrobia bacterium]|nr:efflux RND transporter permease subunit [Elusimicrobiota bacterium]MDE2510869.1 efflux RND transporter permease subunit [Elusimicrobiota bacterium]
MSLSDLSIRNPVFAWMLMLGLMVFGWIGFHRMGVSQLPDVDFPIVNITANWENASPDVMETQVASIIEDSVASVEGITNITSSSRLGSTTVTIEFALNRKIDAAVQDVQSHLSQAQKDLPKDMDPPIIQKVNPEDQPIMWLALSAKPGSDVTLSDICRYINEHLKDELSMIPGVGNINLGGYVDPNLRVWLDADKMAAKEITVEDVLDAINAQHADVPAGWIDTADKEFNVRVYGEAATPAEFANLLIPTRRRGGAVYRKIRISDIGTVEDGLNDIRRISRYQGDRAVGLGIIKQRGTNAVAVADAVDAKVKALEPLLPKGMQLRKVFSSTQFIKDSVRELDGELIRSVILTSLVCLLFLGSWSATLNVLLAIPTSILGTFIILYFCGFTINSFTMLGLSLVVGIIVDDAIMVLENIARYREEGYSKMKAAIVGAREITSAAFAASLAILAIFMPVVLMDGIVGKFFFQFGVTISVAVVISLLEALTIAPMRCSQFLEVGASNVVTRFVDRGMDRVRSGYRRTLEKFLDHPGKVVTVSVVLFALSLSMVRFLKKEFIPSQDQSIFLVNVTLPLGVSLEHTDNLFKEELEPWMKARPELDHYYCAIGGFQGGQVNTGIFFVTMKPRGDRPMYHGHRETQGDFMALVRSEFSKAPGMDRVSILDMSQAGFSAQRGYPIQFMIQGPEWGKLAEYGAEFRKRMKATGLMTDVDTDYNPGMPEIQIHPDRQKAAEHGITARSIGDTINAMIGGVKYGKFTQRGKRYDVRVRLVDKDRNSPKDIDRIWVRDQFGNVVRLPEVITQKVEPSLFAISRYNRERSVSVFANPAAGKSQGEGLEAVQAMAKDILPEGYHIVMSGNAQLFKESQMNMLFVMIMGVFVAYMILATQYNSFIHPVTVLMALPFSVTGAFLGLALTHQSLNIYSMIGLVLLMGIVKKNSILLVDFTNERRKHGLGVRAALLDACPVRLRPILMTSAATIAGATPQAFATGPGSELMVPMAVTVIGGVLVSTALTLLVVPCFYILMSRFESTKSDTELKEALGELGELPAEKTLVHA